MTTASTENLGSIFADPAAYADPVTLARGGDAHPGRGADPAGVGARTSPTFWAITKHADVMEIERNPDAVHQRAGPGAGARRAGVAHDGRRRR